MASKVFLDANILLDYTLGRASFSEAEKIVELIVAGQIQGYITSSVVHIVAYWMVKALGISRTKEYLLAILADVRIIDIPHDVTLMALKSSMNDIEDSLQYYAALHHKLDYFISGDKQFKKEAIPALPVYTAKEFLKEISS